MSKGQFFKKLYDNSVQSYNDYPDFNSFFNNIINAESQCLVNPVLAILNIRIAMEALCSFIIAKENPTSYSTYDNLAQKLTACEKSLGSYYNKFTIMKRFCNDHCHDDKDNSFRNNKGIDSVAIFNSLETIYNYVSEYFNINDNSQFNSDDIQIDCYIKEANCKIENSVSVSNHICRTEKIGELESGAIYIVRQYDKSKTSLIREFSVADIISPKKIDGILSLHRLASNSNYEYSVYTIDKTAVSLKKLVDERNYFEPREALRAVQSIITTLLELKTLGINHRFLRPDRIFIYNPENEKKPYVGFFDHAKLTADNSDMRLSTVFINKPVPKDHIQDYYMPPEVRTVNIKGLNSAESEGLDVYALCVILLFSVGTIINDQVIRNQGYNALFGVHAGGFIQKVIKQRGDVNYTLEQLNAAVTEELTSKSGVTNEKTDVNVTDNAELRSNIKYTIEDTIYTGSFGEIYRIKLKNDIFGDSVKALKKVIIPTKETVDNFGDDKEQLNRIIEQQLECLKNERFISQKLIELGVPNIVKYDDVAYSETNSAAMEYEVHFFMECLTPLEVLIKKKTLTVEHVIRVGTDILEALIKCHENDIIHKDIKEQNIFYDEANQAFKIGNFGAYICRDGHITHHESPEYLAPEILNHGSLDLPDSAFNAGTDIYALGIVLYRLLNFGRNPWLPIYPNSFTDEDKARSFENRCNFADIPLPCDCSPILGKVIVKAINKKDARYNTAEKFKDNLKKAQLLLDENELKHKILDTESKIKSANRKEERFKDAVAFYDAHFANSDESKLNKIIEKFKTLENYKNSYYYINCCRRALDDSKIESDSIPLYYEQAKQLLESKRDIRKLKKARGLLIKVEPYYDVKADLADCTLQIELLNKYNKAVQLFASYNVDDIVKSRAIFTEIHDFMDSDKYINLCNKKLIKKE